MLLTSCADDGGSGALATGAEDSQQSEQQAAEQRRAERQAEFEEAVAQQEAALAGPGPEHRDQAAELVAQMDEHDLAGQVIVGEYSGTDAESAAALIAELNLAGVILMGHNIPGGTSAVDTEVLAAQIESISSAGGEELPAPPIISVDQEGGLVTRVGAPLTEWSTPMAHGAVQPAADGLRSAAQAHRLMAADLAELGFTVSFAPSADVTTGAEDPTIGSRSFGADPETVSALALQGLRGLADGGVAGSVKHFPGHGSVTEDSHYSLPVQQASLEQLRQRDWRPFADAVEAGAPMVMMGHVEVPALEAGVPSSLSEAAYEQIRSMGHEGVIVTDAMNMAAIANSYGGDQAAVQALSAGADLILMPASARGAHQAILTALQQGELDQQRLTEAAQRVLALRLWQQDLASGQLAAGPGVERPEILQDSDIYGPALQEAGPAADDTGQSETGDLDPHQAAAWTAERAVTLVQGECEAVLADEAIQIAGGTQTDRARLADAAQRAGLQTGWGPTVTLLGGRTPGSGDVVVALDRPEALADSTSGAAVALFGRTPASFDALVEVLTGAPAPGALPVPVGDLPAGHSQC